MQTWNYGIGFLVDAQSAPQQNATQNVANALLNIIEARDTDLDGATDAAFLKGALLGVEGKGGLPDTAQLRLFTYIVVGINARPQVRQAVEQGTLTLPDSRAVYLSDRPSLSEMETWVRNQFRPEGMRALWIVTRFTTVPATGTLALPLFGPV